MLNLGGIFERGEGVPVNYDAARAWFEKAAARDFAPAMISLGFLYEHGRGVPRDVAEARRWYEKAAQQGDERGAKELARLQKISETKN